MNSTQRRRTLRNNPTEPEKQLWQKLKVKQLGVKFRRQHPIGQYIVDFYCPEKRLVIELDGESHFTESGKIYDLERDRFMKAQGYSVVRYLNSDVMQNLDGVLVDLLRNLELLP